MSSSPHPSSTKATGSDELGHEDELESLDESLDAILNAAKDHATATDGERPRPVTTEIPGDVEIAATAPSDGIDDDSETPLPVIVDELPSYRAFADEVAPADEAKALDAPPAEVETAAAEADEIFEAESLVESMTPAPELEASAASVAAEPAAEAPVVPSLESLASTEETPAFMADAPSDEQILENVVLPPGATPAPLLATAPSAPAAAAPLPGAELEDDHTVISSPPVPEPSVSLPAPVPVYRSAWSTSQPAAPLSPEPPLPMMMLTRQDDGLTARLVKLAGSKVQTSVAQLALVVVAASALGGGVVKMMAKPQAAAPVVVAAPAPAPKAETAQAAPAPTPAAPAAAEKPAVEKPAVAAEKPAAAKPAAHPVKGHPAPAATHVALATPSKPAAAKHAAPAPAPAKAKKPAAPAQPAAKGAGWVDPFGQ